jgi:hypothetical protein
MPHPILESAAVPHLHCMHFQHYTKLLCHTTSPFEAVTNTYVQVLHSYTSIAVKHMHLPDDK